MCAVPDVSPTAISPPAAEKHNEITERRKRKLTNQAHRTQRPEEERG
jgi:hypothetical protein